MLADGADDLGVVVRWTVRLLLARQRQHDPRRSPATAGSASYAARPRPRVLAHSRQRLSPRGLDDVHDVRAANARGGLEELPGAVARPMNSVCDAPRGEPEVPLNTRAFISRSEPSWDPRPTAAGDEEAALVRDFHRRAAVPDRHGERPRRPRRSSRHGRRRPARTVRGRTATARRRGLERAPQSSRFAPS